MTWEELQKLREMAIESACNGLEITDIDCPKCGKKLYVRTDVILASYPPKREYKCTECGWTGYA